MKTKHLFFITVAASALALGGCKTTEANYKAAYEIAKQKQVENMGGDTSAKLEQFALPKERTVDGVKLEMRTEAIGFPADGGASRAVIKRYNIVVGQFRQIFNARQMRERLIANGYEGACIVSTRNQVYYVVAASCATPKEAAEAVGSVKSDSRITLRAPLPFVLEPSYLAR
ncbi:MAG: SPOR domain-containing protein [Paramuribaculum sp.]|nr:SPOR domain-containing protein [Paramuribaculum sp.]